MTRPEIWIRGRVTKHEGVWASRRPNEISWYSCETWGLAVRWAFTNGSPAPQKDDRGLVVDVVTSWSTA